MPLAVCALLPASALGPATRCLLYLTLVIVIALLAGSLWRFREAPFVSLVGMCYTVAWLLYGQQQLRG